MLPIGTIDSLKNTPVPSKGNLSPSYVSRVIRLTPKQYNHYGCP